jgi:hypothetical protein
MENFLTEDHLGGKGKLQSVSFYAGCLKFLILGFSIQFLILWFQNSTGFSVTVS